MSLFEREGTTAGLIGHNGRHDFRDESDGAIDKGYVETPKAFRFMDLPRDIRLLVYEQCGLQRKHYNITTGNKKYDWCATLIVSSVPAVRLLQTCSTVHDEARLIFQGNQFKRLISEPTRLFIRGSSPHQCSRLLMDIILLIAGLRIDSEVAPQYSGLGRWLHAHSWGPGALPPDHPQQQPIPNFPRREHTRLIVCIDYGIDRDFDAGPPNYLSATVRYLNEANRVC